VCCHAIQWGGGKKVAGVLCWTKKVSRCVIGKKRKRDRKKERRPIERKRSLLEKRKKGVERREEEGRGRKKE